MGPRRICRGKLKKYDADIPCASLEAAVDAARAEMAGNDEEASIYTPGGAVWVVPYSFVAELYRTDIDGFRRSLSDEVEAYKLANSAQGCDCSLEDWLDMSPADRLEYEDGAAVVGTV